MRPIAFGVCFALCMAPAALLPALMPMEGDRIGILVLPWMTAVSATERIAVAGGRFLSIGDRWIVAEGGPGFVSRLHAAGLIHAVSADAVTCIVDPLRIGRSSLPATNQTFSTQGPFAS